jgi:hypothetical protein
MMEEPKVLAPEESHNEAVRPVRKLNKARAFIHNIIIGDFFSQDLFFKNIPFLGYLTILAIVYISNTYYAEKTFRQIEKTKIELKELRFQYISSKSELMYYSKQTEIAKRVVPAGLKETKIPPFKIFYARNSSDTTGEEAKQE